MRKLTKYLFLLIFVSFSSFANNSYIIRNIIIKSTGPNAVIARNIAIEKAQITAFKELLRKVSNHREKIEFSQDDLMLLVKSFEINNEKISPSSYKASFQVSFNRSNVHEFLKKKNIKITKYRISNILVIPTIDGNGYDISINSPTWNKTPWFEAWTEIFSNSDSSSEFILPIGHSTDVQLIKQDDLLTSPQVYFNKIMREYEAASIMVAHVTFEKTTFEDDQKNGHSMILNIRNIKNWRDSYVRKFPIYQGDKIEDIFAIAINDSVESYLTAEPKEKFQKLNKFNLTFYNKSLQEWSSFKKRIQRIESIKKITPSMTNINGTRFKVEYYGRIENLSSDLEELGFELIEFQNEYIIRKKQ